MASWSNAGTHQPVRDESSTSCFISLQGGSISQMCDSSFRQPNSCSLSRFGEALTIFSVHRNSSTLADSLSRSLAPVYRMGASYGNFQFNSLCIRSGRPHKDMFCTSLNHRPNFCVSNTRSTRLCLRRNISLLELNVCLRISAVQLPLLCSSKDQSGVLSDRSYCCSLARTVHRSSVTAFYKSTPSSAVIKFVVWVVRNYPENLHHHAWILCGKASVRKTFMKEHPDKSLRLSDSLETVYDARWSIFSDWCSRREIDPISRFSCFFLKRFWFHPPLRITNLL